MPFVEWHACFFLQKSCRVHFVFVLLPMHSEMSPPGMLILMVEAFAAWLLLSEKTQIGNVYEM